MDAIGLIMMCKLNGRMDMGGYYDLEIKGWMLNRGQYDMQIKWADR